MGDAGHKIAADHPDDHGKDDPQGQEAVQERQALDQACSASRHPSLLDLLMQVQVLFVKELMPEIQLCANQRQGRRQEDHVGEHTMPMQEFQQRHGMGASHKWARREKHTDCCYPTWNVFICISAFSLQRRNLGAPANGGALLAIPALHESMRKIFHIRHIHGPYVCSI